MNRRLPYQSPTEKLLRSYGEYRYGIGKLQQREQPNRVPQTLAEFASARNMKLVLGKRREIPATLLEDHGGFSPIRWGVIAEPREIEGDPTRVTAVVG